MNQTGLRDLARRYAEGSIGKEEYRRARAQFFNDLLAGRINLPSQARAEDPKPRPAPHPAADTLQAMTQVTHTTVVQPPSEPRVPIREPARTLLRLPVWPLASGTAIAAVLAGIIIWLAVTGEETPAPSAPPADTPSANTIDSPASARIEAFLSAQAWDAQTLDAFISDWNSYSSGERFAALSSPSARLLRQAIQRQILEERALLGLGENEAARKRLQRILQFTQEVGLEDPAITASPKSAAGPPESAVAAAAIPPAQAVGATAEGLAPDQANTPCTAGLARPGPAYCRDSLPGNHPGPTLVVIDAGTFTMGGSQPDEQPAREVTIAYPFALSTHEITVGDFELFCRETQRVCPPQPWSGTDYPVVNVTWHDAVAYTQWLSAKTGQRYRLPSEAEWEYAARAGTTTAYPFGDTASPADAVFSPGQPLSAPLPKTDRSIQVNPFYLHHMAGNVREWVADAWRAGYPGAPADGVAYTTGSQDAAELKVVRGGAYIDGPGALRSGARYKLPANTADAYTGFRVLREITGS